MSAPALPYLPKDSLVVEAACLLAGAAVTIGLFFGLARFSRTEAPVRPPEVEDLRAINLPLETPPPPPNPVATSDVLAPAELSTGLEASPGTSPVHLAVSPLAFDLPPASPPVLSEINFTRVYPEFKPGANLAINEQQIYQEADVDQLPRATQRSLQFIPHALRINLNQIRVVLVVLMERNGKASSVRIVKSCGTPALDDIVARSVREDWVFSPAIKRGKPVRCYIQQTFIIKLTPGSPLEAF